ncbi:hypothetical protein RHOW815_000459 [Candidatus Rhabdochlamydia sp. W815]|nr:hypothetical protein RHOW815_000459 [Candidatus Rhabdochlamydia sp. W815]
MKAMHLLQPLVHVNFIQFSMECSRSLNKLTHVISKNLRENREDHELRSSQLDKGIKKIRKMSKVSANTQNDNLNASFFRSHITPRKTTF